MSAIFGRVGKSGVNIENLVSENSFDAQEILESVQEELSRAFARAKGLVKIPSVNFKKDPLNFEIIFLKSWPKII